MNKGGPDTSELVFEGPGLWCFQLGNGLHKEGGCRAVVGLPPSLPASRILQHQVGTSSSLLPPLHPPKHFQPHRPKAAIFSRAPSISLSCIYSLLSFVQQSLTSVQQGRKTSFRVRYLTFQPLVPRWEAVTLAVSPHLAKLPSAKPRICSGQRW